MAKLDLKAMAKEMGAAAMKVLKKRWPAAKTFAESEFRKLGETAIAIQRARLTGEISEKEAALLVEMQKNAMRSVLTTVEGLGILAAEQAVNAALGAVRETLNKFVGWKLF